MRGFTLIEILVAMSIASVVALTCLAGADLIGALGEDLGASLEEQEQVDAALAQLRADLRCASAIEVAPDRAILTLSDGTTVVYQKPTPGEYLRRIPGADRTAAINQADALALVIPAVTLFANGEPIPDSDYDETVVLRGVHDIRWSAISREIQDPGGGTRTVSSRLAEWNEADPDALAALSATTTELVIPPTDPFLIRAWNGMRFRTPDNATRITSVWFELRRAPAPLETGLIVRLVRTSQPDNVLASKTLSLEDLATLGEGPTRWTLALPTPVLPSTDYNLVFSLPQFTSSNPLFTIFRANVPSGQYDQIAGGVKYLKGATPSLASYNQLSMYFIRFGVFGEVEIPATVASTAITGLRIEIDHGPPDQPLTRRCALLSLPCLQANQEGTP